VRRALVNDSAESQRVARVYQARKSLPSDRYHVDNIDVVHREKELKLAIQSILPSLRNKTFLEVGCGGGFRLAQFISRGAEPAKMTGVDIVPTLVNQARMVLPSAVTLETCCGSRVPFEDRSFDIVMQFTMFSSVLDRWLRKEIAQEMWRVVKENGLILSYDMRVNNPWNKEIRGVGRQEIRTLFPGCECFFRRLSLCAPLARKLAKWPKILQSCQAMKIFDTHYLVMIRR
jgi:ubiquinone/menaquinone biosynthesis C-methylase UbiE